MYHNKNPKTKRPLRLRHLRGYRQLQKRTMGIFFQNPVLCYGLALPLVVVPTTSLSSGVAVSLAMLIVYLPTVLLAAYLGERFSKWQRAMAYPCLAAGLLAVARLAVQSISPSVFDSLGVYFSLICVSSLLVVGVEQAVRLRKKPAAVLRFGLCNWLGFSIVVLLLSVFRELLGSGSLWGVAMPFLKMPIPGMLLSGTGFILLGFLVAGARVFHRIITAILLWFGVPVLPARGEGSSPGRKEKNHADLR